MALKECSKIQGHESFPGFSIESYSVNGFYILDVNLNKIEGKTRVETAFSKVFGNSQSEFLVESITFSVNHLHKWINKSRASIIEFPERNKGAIQFDLDKHDQSTFSISSENLSLLESVTIVTSSNRIAHTIEEKPYLKIFENNGEKSFKTKENNQMVFIVPPSVSPFIDMSLYAKLGITEGNTSFWKRVLINDYQVKIDKY